MPEVTDAVGQKGPWLVIGRNGSVLAYETDEAEARCWAAITDEWPKIVSLPVALAAHGLLAKNKALRGVVQDLIREIRDGSLNAADFTSVMDRARATLAAEGTAP